MTLASPMFQQFALFAGLISLFSGVTVWAVKAVVDAKVGAQNDVISKGLRSLSDHIDEKFSELEDKVDAHDKHLRCHDGELNEQKIANLKLRNEVLEAMRDNYVRREDLHDIKAQISAMFRKIDAVLGVKG